MSAAALAGLIGQLSQSQGQLPLQYGNLYLNAYGPGFGYLQNQANNMTNLGQAGLGLYGNLSGQQASMYQAELPHQMEMAMYNSLAPALSSLLGSGGFGPMPAISPLNVQFNRPDVMSGYGQALDTAYTNAAGYDSAFGGLHADMMDKMPTAQYMSRPVPKPPAPLVAADPRASAQRRRKALPSRAVGPQPGFAPPTPAAPPPAPPTPSRPGEMGTLRVQPGVRGPIYGRQTPAFR